MNKKVTIFTIMILTLMIGVPVDGFASPNSTTKTSVTTGSVPEINVLIAQPRRGRGRHRRGGYWRNGRYYRNYGQYRRSVVGNRRFRTVRRYYWRKGRRVIRYQRVYY
jgi:hypothetical protein